MSIRLIARDLYRCVREVERLEAALTQAPPEKRPALEDALRKARAERDFMRRVLNGQKEDSTRNNQ